MSNDDREDRAGNLMIEAKARAWDALRGLLEGPKASSPTEWGSMSYDFIVQWERANAAVASVSPSPRAIAEEIVAALSEKYPGGEVDLSQEDDRVPAAEFIAAIIRKALTGA